VQQHHIEGVHGTFRVAVHFYDSPSVLTSIVFAAEIEAPVRDSAPDGGPPIRERATEFDREIVTSAGNREKEILGSEVSIADAFRFKGALPEVANCR